MEFPFALIPEPTETEEKLLDAIHMWMMRACKAEALLADIAYLISNGGYGE